MPTGRPGSGGRKSRLPRAESRDCQCPPPVHLQVRDPGIGPGRGDCAPEIASLTMRSGRCSALLFVHLILVACSQTGDGADAVTIILRSCDGGVVHRVKVQDIIDHSPVMKNLVEGVGTGGTVPLHGIASNETQLIADFVTGFAVHQTDEASQWVQDRLNGTRDDDLGRLLMAADYLAMRSLMVAIASMNRPGIPRICETSLPEHAAGLFAGLCRLDQVANTISQKAIAKHVRVLFVTGGNGTLVNSGEWDGAMNVLHWAASNDERLVVDLLLSVPEIDVNVRDPYWKTPLHYAAVEGHTPIVRLLLVRCARGRINVNARDHENRTALHDAASEGNVDVVKLLCGVVGIDVTAQDTFGWTALHEASSAGLGDVVEALLNVPGIDVNARDNEHCTPLYMAASSGDADVVTLLANADGIVINASDRDDFAPLHVAAYNGHADAVRALINAAGITVDATDSEGQTALDRATAEGHYDVMEILKGKRRHVE